MGIWKRIVELAKRLGNSLSEVLTQMKRGSTDPQKSMAFTIGLVALGAKMARADGVVVDSEIRAFRQVFKVADKDLASVERVFNLAKEDSVGFEFYAKNISRLFAKKSAVLEQIIDCLFHIAKADGSVTLTELSYIDEVAKIFGFEKHDLARIKSRHVKTTHDPFEILGLKSGASREEIKKQYRSIVNKCHPDRLIARGVPPEVLKSATEKLIVINSAYQTLMKD